MLNHTASVRQRLESVRAMIHLLEDEETFDEQGKEIAHKVDQAFAALAEELEPGSESDESESEETPLFI